MYRMLHLGLGCFLTLLQMVMFGQGACVCEQGEKLKPEIYRLADAGNFDSVEVIYDGLRLSPNESCLLFYYHGMSQIYMQKQQMSEAGEFLHFADKFIANGHCNSSIASKHYSITGLYFTRNNQLDSAQWAFLKAVEYAEESGDKYAMARAYGDVAATLFKIGDVSRSIKFDSMAVRIAKSLTDNSGIALLAAKLVNLSSAYLSLHEKEGLSFFLNRAKFYADQAIYHSRKCNDIKGILESYGILSKYHLVLKNYDSCIFYCDSMIIKHISKFTNYTTYLAFYHKAIVYDSLHRIKLALINADSSYLYASLFNVDAEVKALSLRYKLYKENKQLDSALIFYERLTHLKDSVFGNEKARMITELEHKYNQSRNEKRISDLDFQKLIIALIALGIFLMSAGIIFSLKYKSSLQKTKILEIEQRLNRARMNPHFFFNALSALQKLALVESKSLYLVNAISKFSQIMRETLESTYTEYNTLKKEMEYLDMYIDLQRLRFPDLLTYSIKIQEGIDPEEILIPCMLLQPIVENSIEHGFSSLSYIGELSINVSIFDSVLKVEVVDNGIGLSREKERENGYTSRAMQIIGDRLYLLNSQLKTKAFVQINDNKDKAGVSVSIVLPLRYSTDLEK